MNVFEPLFGCASVAPIGVDIDLFGQFTILQWCVVVGRRWYGVRMQTCAEGR